METLPYQQKKLLETNLKKEWDWSLLKTRRDLTKIAERERSPMYTVGEVTGTYRFTFESKTKGDKPMDLALEDMFGSSPKPYLPTILVVEL